MKESPLSLRERNRLETWATIHEVTATLVIERGWARTTIERIAAQAGISARTFFNYFPNKEAAALGLLPVAVPDDALTAFHDSDADIFDRTAKLIIAILQTATPNDGLDERRARLLNDVPELRAHMTLFSATAGDLVEPILLAEPSLFSQEHSADFPSAEETAKIIRMTAGAMIRYALTQFTGSAAELQPEHLTNTVSQFRKVLQQII